MFTEIETPPLLNQPNLEGSKQLLFINEEESEYWKKLLDSNIRIGTMACVWCIKTQIVKKTSLAFHHWKLMTVSYFKQQKSLSKQTLSEVLEKAISVIQKFKPACGDCSATTEALVPATSNVDNNSESRIACLSPEEVEKQLKAEELNKQVITNVLNSIEHNHFSNAHLDFYLREMLLNPSTDLDTKRRILLALSHSIIAKNNNTSRHTESSQNKNHSYTSTSPYYDYSGVDAVALTGSSLDPLIDNNIIQDQENLHQQKQKQQQHKDLSLTIPHAPFDLPLPHSSAVSKQYQVCNGYNHRVMNSSNDNYTTINRLVFRGNVAGQFVKGLLTPRTTTTTNNNNNNNTGNSSNYHYSAVIDKIHHSENNTTVTSSTTAAAIQEHCDDVFANQTKRHNSQRNYYHPDRTYPPHSSKYSLNLNESINAAQDNNNNDIKHSPHIDNIYMSHQQNQHRKHQHSSATAAAIPGYLQSTNSFQKKKKILQDIISSPATVKLKGKQITNKKQQHHSNNDFFNNSSNKSALTYISNSFDNDMHNRTNFEHNRSIEDVFHHNDTLFSDHFHKRNLSGEKDAREMRLELNQLSNNNSSKSSHQQKLLQQQSQNIRYNNMSLIDHHLRKSNNNSNHNHHHRNNNSNSNSSALDSLSLLSQSHELMKSNEEKINSSSGSSGDDVVTTAQSEQYHFTTTTSLKEDHIGVIVDEQQQLSSDGGISALSDNSSTDEQEVPVCAQTLFDCNYTSIDNMNQDTGSFAENLNKVTDTTTSHSTIHSISTTFNNFSEDEQHITTLYHPPPAVVQSNSNKILHHNNTVNQQKRQQMDKAQLFLIYGNLADGVHGSRNTWLHSLRKFSARFSHMSTLRRQ